MGVWVLECWTRLDWLSVRMEKCVVFMRGNPNTYPGLIWADVVFPMEPFVYDQLESAFSSLVMHLPARA